VSDDEEEEEVEATMEEMKEEIDRNFDEEAQNRVTTSTVTERGSDQEQVQIM
jgi:hypothetical protein